MNDIRVDRGSATILMMLIASVIITVGLGFNWLVKEHIHASEGLKRKADAIMKARSAYDAIIYLVLTGRVTQTGIDLPEFPEVSSLRTLPLDGQEVLFVDDVYVRLKDSNGKISLTTPNMGALARLIEKMTGRDSVSNQIDNFVDWIDPDNLVRVNGAEDFYYKGESRSFTARNYALQYQEEFGFIKDFGIELYGRLKPYLTMLPSSGFNPNTASGEVLKAYLDINEDSRKALQDYIAKKPVASNVELFSLTGRQIDYNIEGVYFYPSLYMDAAIRVGRPRSLYSISAGLDITPKPYAPYGILYWREE